jgi:hypothetical protein
MPGAREDRTTRSDGSSLEKPPSRLVELDIRPVRCKNGGVTATIEGEAFERGWVIGQDTPALHHCDSPSFRASVA